MAFYINRGQNHSPLLRLFHMIPDDRNLTLKNQVLLENQLLKCTYKKMIALSYYSHHVHFTKYHTRMTSRSIILLLEQLNKLNINTGHICNNLLFSTPVDMGKCEIQVKFDL